LVISEGFSLPIEIAGKSGCIDEFNLTATQKPETDGIGKTRAGNPPHTGRTRSVGMPGPSREEPLQRRRFGAPQGSRQGTGEVVPTMMHFSCDICGKQMLPGARAHFVLKMEVYAATDPAQLTEDDLDPDHLEEISQLLAEEEATAEEVVPAYKKLRYDLCQSCHKRFLSDPLGREAAQKFDFSEN